MNILVVCWNVEKIFWISKHLFLCKDEDHVFLKYGKCTSISWEYGELILLKVVIDLSCWYMNKKCIYVHYKYNINIINVLWNQYHSKILHGNTYHLWLTNQGLNCNDWSRADSSHIQNFLFELLQKIVTAFQ